MTDTLITIRGSRIADMLEEQQEFSIDETLLETTFAQLYFNVKKGFPKTLKRQFSTQPLKVDQIKITPFVGVKTLMVRGVVASDSGKKYDTILSFLKVTYMDDDTDQSMKPVNFTASDGDTYTIKQINLKETNIQVRCNCLDFRWRFSNYNSKDKSLFGRKPPAYTKKTNRPPVNPTKVPGVCKHLLSTMQALYQAGLVTKT